jgi:hypothetical protein
MPRLFTREEAEALLPHLAPMLTKLRTLKEDHDRAQRKLAELTGMLRSNGHQLDDDLKTAREEMEQAASAVNEIISRVNDLGCELKDVDMGLVDFRSERDGREVYLCWKLGEERIDWWHELHTGYASRQPLE